MRSPFNQFVKHSVQLSLWQSHSNGKGQEGIKNPPNASPNSVSDSDFIHSKLVKFSPLNQDRFQFFRLPIRVNRRPVPILWFGFGVRDIGVSLVWVTTTRFLARWILAVI